MTPIKYTVKEDVTYFHYNFSELMNFARLGFKEGNTGLILTKRQGNLLTYRGFGTIENPCKHVLTITMAHCPPFDGKMPTDDQRLIPPKPFLTKKNTRMIILDLSEIDPLKIKK